MSVAKTFNDVTQQWEPVLYGARGPVGETGLRGPDAGLVIPGSNRYYGVNATWTSIFGDPSYGFVEAQMSEAAGSGADPIFEWENQALPVRAGWEFRGITMHIRNTHAEVEDLEIRGYQIPSPGGWESYSSDTDENNLAKKEHVFTDFVLGTTTPVRESAWSATYPVVYQMDMSHIFEFDSTFHMFFRPVGTLTGTRYFYITYLFHFGVPE